MGRIPVGAKAFLQRWTVNTLAVLVASFVVPGIRYEHWGYLLLATLVLGVLHAGLRPLLMVLSLPLLILTLGLFTFVINAFLLYAVGLLLAPNFTVQSFGAAFWGALIATVVSLLLNSLTGTGHARVIVRRGRMPRRPPDDDPGGPVIDV
jgi:putative membrane protein